MFIRLSFFLFTCLFLAPLATGQVVLIDPGHGGEDCGATTTIRQTVKGKVQETIICEKDIALGIAQKIQARLASHFNVYLTRSIDRDLSLHDRARQADMVKADVFVSIHLNASTSARSHGFETFYLNNHNNAAVRRIEEIENRDSGGELTIVDKILTDLVIERTAPRSKKLADLIHGEVAKRITKPFSINDRGVKPALFFVLALTKRPAVLLEAGFISNDREVQKILSEDFQNAYAEGVAQGLIEYFKEAPRVPLF
jgi:N-acetylmuramoyl-L-alanine amidase